ncbi:MAG: GNAT family N-acetyltransferase, partial [Dehalococcoidia bacterium]|nr:GNAT family N-acetyltransferase [Dehalococcoidia bacterium]
MTGLGTGDGPKKSRPRYWIRPMREEDIPQVLDIDHEAFSTQWPPASYTSLKQELKNRMAHYIVLCCDDRVTLPSPADPASPNIWQRLLTRLTGYSPGPPETLATPQRDSIIGFAGIWKIYDEAHLISIAVRQPHRRRGFGELLMLAVIHLAFLLQAKVITLEVR